MCRREFGLHSSECEVTGRLRAEIWLDIFGGFCCCFFFFFKITLETMHKKKLKVERVETGRAVEVI